MRPDPAARFVAALHAAHDPAEVATVRRRVAADDEVIGMRMRDLFAAAKAATGMPLADVDGLLDSPVYEVRMGALCIMDFRAKDRRVTPDERAELYRLYLDRHDRITTWDMVDRAAPSVVGGRLLGRDPAPLARLAAAPEPLRRRTAITAPLWFVRHGGLADVEHVFPLAAALAGDPDPSVSAAVGIALEHAGARHPQAAAAFLDAHGATLPRPVLRAAMSKLPAP
ncbi:DNA alkylation repair protein [Actinomycetospora rhizophila]|uniref:DNA alkylation repair protein n=1 Tax=Actinomycetospora rhizophila TaxID=1416876 RepID=A0ABV9ZG04_9PSEU